MRVGKISGLTMALALLWICSPVFGENKPANIWASAQFNKASVAVGEPLLVTITVYTSTWFTSPPKFSEIQVPDAIMVEYEQRTGSMRKTIGNKSYPAIEKKFLVYPLKEGENILPSLTIITESPAEGDYKGKRRVIKSPERSFQVRPTPGGVQMDQWLTAYNVILTEHWDRIPEELRQGDVLDRRISIQATGALAALIPPLELAGTGFGNVYPREPVLNNVQNQSSFTGTRTETWTYLMESQGSYTIPGITVSWYDPVSKKVKSAAIESRKITIVANPDMAFLLTMQDSLQAVLETGEGDVQEAFEWMGLNWWQLIVAVLSLLIVLYLIYSLVRRIVSTLRARKAAAIESEERYFEDFVKVSREGNPALVLGALHAWYDRFREDRYGPVFGDFICATGDPELRTQFMELEGILFGHSDPGSWSGRELATLVTRHRKSMSGTSKPNTRGELPLLNPGKEEALSCLKSNESNAG